MISELWVIGEIDSANVNFIWCWERFQRFKRLEIEREGLFQFQVKLTKGIGRLDRVYRLIKGEQERLVGRKLSYSPKWFARRMAKLDVYLKAVKEAIGIGRSLGDGFAWIFYRNEPELLEEHAREQRQLLLPPAVGGIGELAFVDKMQGLGGKFVVYHAITSYLRLGDVSFFDPTSSEITAIGELKTRHGGGDLYYITLGYVTGDRNSLPFQNAKPETVDNKYKPLDRPTQQKLRRQMDQLSKAIEKRMNSDGDPRVVSSGKFHFDVLERLLRNCGEKQFEMERAGPGLMLGAWRSRHRDSLGKRLLRESGSLDAAVAPVKDSVSAILNPELRDNCLFVGSLGSTESGYPVMLTGGTPMLWWPIADQQLHDLLFGHVLIMTFFNPAQLWNVLRIRGYEVIVDERSRAVKLIKSIGKRRLVFERFSYFEHLAPYALADEQTIADMIDTWAEQAIASTADAPARVLLRPLLRVGFGVRRNKRQRPGSADNDEKKPL